MKNILLIGTATPMRNMLEQELIANRYHVMVIDNGKKTKEEYNGKLMQHTGDLPTISQIANCSANNDIAIITLQPINNTENPYDEIIERYTTIIKGLDNSSIKRIIIVGGGGELLMKNGEPLMLSKHFSPLSIPYFKAMTTIYNRLKEWHTTFDWLFMVPPEIIIKGFRTKQIRYSETEILASENGFSIISMEDFAYALRKEISLNSYKNTLIHTD